MLASGAAGPAPGQAADETGPAIPQRSAYPADEWRRNNGQDFVWEQGT